MKTPTAAATWQRRVALARIYGVAALRLTVALAVLAGCILADSAVLAYELGRQTGAAVHARNDQLAALAVRLLAPSEPPTAAPAAPAPVADPARPAPPAQPAPVAHKRHATPRPATGDTAAEIRRLAADGMSQRRIATTLGISRHRVKAALTA